MEVKAQFQYKEEEEILKLPSSRKSRPKCIYTKKDDVSDKKYGLTPGCRECEAVNRGLVGIHLEDYTCLLHI